MNWGIVLTIQVIVWLIVIVEWKQLKKLSRKGKVLFSSLLLISVIFSFLNLETLAGPRTVLDQIFGPLGDILE
ncbi:hypothetical protein [Ornithinibacillus californiensis]|uniref:hypothetical protein n=1 Tax=Ornithinibacillus californiensis TaxID=161536 RepID=UPI00064D730B|nr:hypothetical protein [Ornithinibacillus californiensis]